MKHIYYIDKDFHLDPPSLGYPFARPRAYIRCRHKVKVLAEISPLNSFAKRFHRAVNFAWKDIFFHLAENGKHATDFQVVDDEAC